MDLLSLTVCVLCVLIPGLHAAPLQDLVTELPGLSWTPSFKHYSGYLETARSKHLHYWFVESSSNPCSDPVVLWMNGGPGCSSLHGLLTEHGPFRIRDDGKTIDPNPFAWNKVANMIYLEAPAGVGFSYSDDRNYTTDDIEVALNNHLALKDFFKKFPEYQSNDLYISGESYAGIYVPTLVDVTIGDPDINLKGFIVGNGVSSTDKNLNSLFYFAYYHGLVGEKRWRELVLRCCPRNTDPCDFVLGLKLSTQCSEWFAEIVIQIWGGVGLNPYNMYAECTGGVSGGGTTLTTSRFLYPFSNLFTKDSKRDEMAANQPHSPPCVNSDPLISWLNDPQVKHALHVSEQAQPWHICRTINYDRIFTDMTAQYRRAINKKMRILVYNGDVDMAVNFLGVEWFVNSLNAEGERERKTWYYKAQDNTTQVAGWFTDFHQITLATVRGAGHMVPTDKPRPALKMFMNFIRGQSLDMF